MSAQPPSSLAKTRLDSGEYRNVLELVGRRGTMNKVLSPIISLLSLVVYTGTANAELSAVERERLHLCPKNCAPYCEEIPAKPTYCTCFCHAPGPTAGKDRPKRPHY